MVGVSNGIGSAYADLNIVGHASNGSDYFNIGVPWGRDFLVQNGPNYTGLADNGDHHIYDVTADPFLAIHAKGDGVSDDRPAIQQAITQAANHGGGIVYLPAGNYRLGYVPYSWGITMASGVVLKGHSPSDTVILMGPSQNVNGTYSSGFGWPANATLTGLANLSIQNLDTLSQNDDNAHADGPVSKLFFQNLNWNMGTGGTLHFYKADRLVIENSKFHAAINTRFPNPNCPQNSGRGPVDFWNLTNFLFQNNSFGWASGDIEIITSQNSVIEGNHFTRSASDQIKLTAANNSCFNQNTYYHPYKIGDMVQRNMGRQMEFDFAKNFAIQNNIFDVSEGTLAVNFFDGETINAEGGGGNFQQDVGTATAATTTTITDNSNPNKTWNYSAGYRIAVVSGTGWGQWRNITSKSGNTFTVDQAWSIMPAPGDHFSIFHTAMENGLIRGNKISNNPSGILLWHQAFYNVSIINNSLTDNGGILLFALQDVNNNNAPQTGNLRNIEVNGNTLTDTKSQWSSYITIAYSVVSPNYFWGTGLDGIEVRNNTITARLGNPVGTFHEGYWNLVEYQDSAAPYSPNGAAPAILGTIFQGNTCINCPVFYRLSTGDLDTVIWNSSISAVTPQVFAPTPIIQDNKIWNTAPQASSGTVVGHD
jgi:Pectate lyase superfamily protein